MNLSPEEQQNRWHASIDRQNERHEADQAYKEWLRANRLSDERYPTQLAAASYGLDYADLGIEPAEEAALGCLTLEIVQRLHVLPWRIVGRTLYVAVADLNWPADEVERLAGLPVKPVLASPQAIQYRIAKHFAA